MKSPLIFLCKIRLHKWIKYDCHFNVLNTCWFHAIKFCDRCNQGIRLEHTENCPRSIERQWKW